MNSILTHDLTNSPMEEMKQESTNMMDRLVEEETTYILDKLVEEESTNVMGMFVEEESTNMMDRLVEEESTYIMDKLAEVPNLFFCILALLAFSIIGFVLHICWKAEASRVQEWFCNGTSRQHRWRALHALQRKCVQEELFQKPAAKMEAEIDNKGTSKEGKIYVGWT